MAKTHRIVGHLRTKDGHNVPITSKLVAHTLNDQEQSIDRLSAIVSKQHEEFVVLKAKHDALTSSRWFKLGRVLGIVRA